MADHVTLVGFIVGGRFFVAAIAPEGEILPDRYCSDLDDEVDADFMRHQIVEPHRLLMSLCAEG